MFHNCSSLVSIDLSNSDTSSVYSMGSIFYGCTSLISLDLNGFNISKVYTLYQMFYNCYSLIFINLNSFVESQNIIITNIFFNVSNDIIYCIDEERAPKILMTLQEKNFNNSCSNICFNE